MAETQETIADIIAEMHRFAKQHEYDHPDMDTNARGIEDYADRLEAAHERELEAGGNAAKLREAMSELVKYLEETRQYDDATGNLAAFLLKKFKLRAALAAPPSPRRRNCDVGTPEEQAERFHKFCMDNSSEIQGMCRSSCPCIDSGDKCHCLCKWAQMPYEAQEGAKE